MYTLTLSRDERRAFDWVGNRYNNGDAMARILMDSIPPMAEDRTD